MKTLAFAGIAILAACGAQTEFADGAAVVSAQRDAGFVQLGSFGNARGPLTVVEERTSRDVIEFTRADGTRHRYPGYTGYTLKMVRLEGAGGDELLLVFRSAEKG